MIDHVGFSVSDFERSKAFYLKALAPLGYGLVMEVPAAKTEAGHTAAGFGANGKPDFWIAGEGKLEKAAARRHCGEGSRKRQSDGNRSRA